MFRLNNKPESTQRCAPQFNTDLVTSTQKSVTSTHRSVQHKKASFLQTHYFNTKTVSSTHHSVQRKKASVQHLKIYINLCCFLFCVKLTGVLNWRFFWVNLTHMWWTDAFLVLILGAEKEWSFCVELICRTIVCVEVLGTL